MKRKTWLYLAGFSAVAVALSWLLAGLAIRDRVAEVPFLFSTLAKLLVILLILYDAKISGTGKYLLCGRIFSRDTVWLALPLIASVLICYGAIDTRPGALAGAMMLLGVVAGVVWEELYFRFAARLLFERCGKYHLLVVVLTSVVYGGVQLFRALYQPIGVGVGLMLFVLTTAQGIFLTALYSKTKNILVPLLAHLAQDVPRRCSISSRPRRAVFSAQASFCADCSRSPIRRSASGSCSSRTISGNADRTRPGRRSLYRPRPTSLPPRKRTLRRNNSHRLSSCNIQGAARFFGRRLVIMGCFRI